MFITATGICSHQKGQDTTLNTAIPQRCGTFSPHPTPTRAAREAKRYLLRSGHLEPSGVDAAGQVGLHRVLVTGVTRGVRNHGWVLSHRLGGAGDGGLRGQAHLVVQGLVQFLVCVRPALRVRVLVVRRVPAVRAVHGVLAPWRGQVGQAVVVDVQVILRGAVRLSGGRDKERAAR